MGLGRRPVGTGESGGVTAEFAVLVPAVLLVLGLALGCMGVVAQQVRVTDAAAGAARSLGRGDSPDTARTRVAAWIGAADISSRREGDFVCVRVEQVPGFAPAAVAGLRVAARSCALAGAP